MVLCIYSGDFRGINDLFMGLALKMISPTQAAVCSGFNPLTAILAGALFLGESITLLFVIGFTCYLCSSFTSDNEQKRIKKDINYRLSKGIK